MSLPDLRSLLYEATAFGNVELVAPLVCGIATALWIAREKRNAKNFFVAFLICLALVATAKVVMMIVWSGGPLRSPSGHSAISAYLYGSIALMLVASSRSLFARALAAGCAALAMVIAVSRFEIGGHSRSEVLLGLAFGGACALLFKSRFTRLKRPAVATTALAVVAGVVVTGAFCWLLAPGYVDEETIAHFARWLRGFLRTA